MLSQKPDAVQFIQALDAQGINVLFNQASTGFVSGISYGFEGMQFKGAHLGNAYKWQAVKNAISYEQERDRTAIHQANVRTREQQSARAGQSVGTDANTKVATGNRRMYSRAMENYRIRLEKQIESTSRRLEMMESAATNLAF